MYGEGISKTGELIDLGVFKKYRNQGIGNLLMQVAEDIAKKYADKFDWYFKPHPRLKHALIKNNIMTEQEANDYYMQWQKVGKICDSGDYFEMFQESSKCNTET